MLATAAEFLGAMVSVPIRAMLSALNLQTTATEGYEVVGFMLLGNLRREGSIFRSAAIIFRYRYR